MLLVVALIERSIEAWILIEKPATPAHHDGQPVVATVNRFHFVDDDIACVAATYFTCDMVRTDTVGHADGAQIRVEIRIQQVHA
ncbi:hypothetical protein ABXK61_30655 [Burkholderia sola]|uniref:hypothetical protein n=1 Tax=Burkholderia TaxID=32008 RepID=UPI001AE7A816|nr:hypothetical protein [Burkholderia sp. AcTa6-5]MBP0717635.1 hypothetical protein [Burkholderia sp. AcTa6-5]